MSWYGGKESMVHEQVYGNSKDRLHHDCQSRMMVLMLMTVTLMIIMITNYFHGCYGRMMVRWLPPHGQ